MSAAPATGTVALYAEFAAVPGRGREVESLLAGFAELVRAEPGNLVFDAYCMAAEPDRFFVYEIYRDQTAFDAHIAADTGATFNSALKELTVGDGSTLTFLRSVNALP